MDDPYLKDFIKENAARDQPCGFCRRRPSADLDAVMEIIGNTVTQYYDRAVNEAPWDGREGGYQGTTYDTSEVMDEIVEGISRRRDVMDAIMDSFPEDIWVERNMFALNGVHLYTASWDHFCNAVKYETRYFFNVEEDDELHETIPVPMMLDWLRGQVQESGMLTTLPSDTIIYRVRSHEKTETCDTWQSLGSPPRERAPSNRMSAAGISVFYGAFDIETARIEASVSAPEDNLLTGAAWTCSRPLYVLDLTELPPTPSIFASSRDERGAILFLAEFVKSITAPVKHDGREHIEYVPTQILTEYFRRLVKGSDGQTLDGIVYPSARQPDGSSIVIFAPPERLDADAGWGEEPLLKLDVTSVKRQARP